MGKYLRAILPPVVQVQFKEPEVVLGVMVKVLLPMGPATEPELFMVTVMMLFVTTICFTYLPLIEVAEGRPAIRLLNGKDPVLVQKSAMLVLAPSASLKPSETCALAV